MLIDTHCHLDFDGLSGDARAGVLQRAADAGVGRMITIATRKHDWPTYLAIAASDPRLYCTIGVHPDHAAEAGEEVAADELIALANANPRIVGFGECGLDYYHPGFDAAAQARGLDAHISAAQATGLPVVIHARDADADMAAQLTRRFSEQPYTGLLHCFSSGLDLARAALEIGFYVSFSGIVTFKNATLVQEAARLIPLDRMLVETDAPYLAPVPFRGKPNEPSYVAHTAQYLADLKGLPFADFAAVTTRNAEAVFTRLQSA